MRRHPLPTAPATNGALPARTCAYAFRRPSAPRFDASISDDGPVVVGRESVWAGNAPELTRRDDDLKRREFARDIVRTTKTALDNLGPC
jgi:hypothetical protein